MIIINEDFWDEVFLLKINKNFLENCFRYLNEQDLWLLKVIFSIFY